MDVNGRTVSVSLGPEGISVDGDPIEARIEEVDGTPIVLLIAGGTLHRLAVRRGDGRGRYSIWSESHRFEVEALDERRRAIRDMAGASSESTGPAPLVAPMPGLVVRINVEAGDPIRAGQPLVVMEAMKMENELRSTSDGVVRAVRVQSGEAVEKGTVLIELAES